MAVIAGRRRAVTAASCRRFARRYVNSLALAANPCDDIVTPERKTFGAATAAEAGRRLNVNEEEVRHHG